MYLIDYLSEETGRAAAMAGRVGLSSQFLYQIARGKRPCPADHAPAVEAASEGRVRRWELRPRDWHRIWPELIGTPGAPPVPADAAQHLQACETTGKEAGQGVAKAVEQG